MEEELCRIRFYLDICCTDTTAKFKEDSDLAVLHIKYFLLLLILFPDMMLIMILGKHKDIYHSCLLMT